MLLDYLTDNNATQAAMLAGTICNRIFHHRDEMRLPYALHCSGGSWGFGALGPAVLRGPL